MNRHRDRFLLAAFASLIVLPSVSFAGRSQLTINEIASERAGVSMVYDVRVPAGSAGRATVLASDAACEAAANAIFAGALPQEVDGALRDIGKKGCNACIERAEVMGSEAVGGTYSYQVVVQVNRRQLERQFRGVGFVMTADEKQGVGPLVIVFEEFVCSFAGRTLVEEDVRADWRKEILDVTQGFFKARRNEVISRGEVDDALASLGATDGYMPRSMRADIREWATDHGANSMVELSVEPREDGGRIYWSASLDIRRLSDSRSLGSAVGRSAFIRDGAAPTLDLFEAAVHEAASNALEQALMEFE
jgi:hypothetical protein